MAESISRNRRKHGNRAKLNEAEVKKERDSLERTEQTIEQIDRNIRKKVESLYPSYVTYKMTNSEIANKSRKMAYDAKLRVRDLNLLA